MFAPALVGLSLRVDATHARALPIAVSLWCAGRVMFAIGYHVHPRCRAIGFDWTYYTAAATLLWFASTLL